MRSSMIWLRVSYWVGAIADGIVALAMFAETFLALPSPLTHSVPDLPYRYAMGLAGSLMLGWTILLLWADRKPRERRGVLIITNVVILGLMASGLFAVSSGFISLGRVAPSLVFQVLLIVLFTSSYLGSVRRERQSS